MIVTVALFLVVLSAQPHVFSPFLVLHLQVADIKPSLQHSLQLGLYLFIPYYVHYRIYPICMKVIFFFICLLIRTHYKLSHLDNDSNPLLLVPHLLKQDALSHCQQLTISQFFLQTKKPPFAHFPNQLSTFPYSCSSIPKYSTFRIKRQRYLRYNRFPVGLHLQSYT